MAALAASVAGRTQPLSTSRVPLRQVRPPPCVPDLREDGAVCEARLTVHPSGVGVSGWTDEELRRVGDAVELDLASRRAGEERCGYTTMWVVRVGDEHRSAQPAVRTGRGTDTRSSAALAGSVPAAPSATFGSPRSTRASIPRLTPPTTRSTTASGPDPSATSPARTPTPSPSDSSGASQSGAGVCRRLHHAQTSRTMAVRAARLWRSAPGAGLREVRAPPACFAAPRRRRCYGPSSGNVSTSSSAVRMMSTSLCRSAVTGSEPSGCGSPGSGRT